MKTDEMLDNNITTEDNIVGNSLNNNITTEDNIVGNALNNEITTEDNIASNKKLNDLNNFESYWNNYQDFSNGNSEYILTNEGYVIVEEDSIFDKSLFYAKDLGVGTARGVTKLTESVGGLGLATLEKLNLVSDGSVQKFGEFFKNEVYPRIGETETLAGGFAEGIAQYLTPGLGYYKLFNTVIKAKGVLPFITRALAAEAATVGTAQVPTDPNFLSFMSEIFGVDTKTADSMSKEIFIYLATPETDYNADSVFEEKMKAIIADSALGPVGEGIVPMFKIISKMFKSAKSDKQIMKEINDAMPDVDIDNPPPGVIEDKMPQKGDVDYEEPASGGLSKDRDAMDDLNKDIAAQVEEVDTSYQIDNKAISKFNTSLDKQNISLVSMEPKGDIMHDMYVEQMNIIKSVINNPNKKITVYRVVPKNVKNAKINEGDYVALTKKLAGAFGEPQTHQIISLKVKAKDIYTSAEGKTGASFLYKKRGNK